MSRFFLIFLFAPFLTQAQKWVDTTYQIKVERDIAFGQVLDFAGNYETLTMDIAYPTNDTPPTCGRPLILVFYGGAWMGGDKNVNEVQRLMQDFAKRGYVAVAPNYRLGLFQTASAINCNISSLFNVEWNCLNVQDTAEWYRAYFRAIQDCKGALRYMVANRLDYNLNPQNIFTAGFSAGGFNALGVAFWDHIIERIPFMDSLKSAVTPNAIYDNRCVKKFQWDTSIASMNLIRPSLGSLDGDLNHPKYSYIIRAAGNFYGGMFFNLLENTMHNGKEPAIYGFHQPNDLIVPYKKRQKSIRWI